MPLNIIYGKAKTGKSTLCLDKIDELLNKSTDDKNIILLVPDQFSYITEKNAVVRFGAIGHTTVDVMTFSRMIRTALSYAKTPSLPYIKPSGKNMLIYLAIQNVKKELILFNKSLDKSGFIDVVKGLISEFKRYNISPELLEKTATEISNDTMLQTKLTELSKLYNSFNELMNSSFLDSEDDLNRLADIIINTDIFDNAHIFIDEFSDFLPQHYTVLEALVKKANSVTITLTMDNSFNENGMFSPCVATHNKVLATFGIDNKTYLDSQRAKISKGLLHLAENISKITKTPYNEPCNDITVFEALDVYGEAEFIARNIIRLCREEGYKFSDIAVICADTSYSGALSVVFNEYAIKYFTDQKKPLLKNNVSTLLFSIFDVLNTNFGYDSIFTYLKTGLTPVSRTDIDVIENYVLMSGMTYISWLDDSKWRYVKNSIFDATQTEEKKEYLDKINQIRKKAIEPFVNFKNKLERTKTVKEITTALYEFLTIDINLFETISALVKILSKNQADIAQEYSQVWNIIIEVFDQLVSVAGDNNIGLEGFSNMLFAGLSGYEIGVIPPSVDEVMILDARRSRCKNIKAVFIAGAVYGNFPSVSSAEGVLSDADRLSLSKIGVSIAPDTRKKSFDEQFLIYKTLLTPTQKLFLTYPTADSEGHSQRPSYIINQLMRIFPKLNFESGVIYDDFGFQKSLVSLPQPTLTHLTHAMRKKHDKMPYSTLWNEIFAWYEHTPKYNSYCKRLSNISEFEKKPSILEASTVRNLYNGDLHTSVTRLEAYSACPYKHFASYILRAKQRRILKLEAPDIGSILHSIIEKFCARVEENIDENNLYESKKQRWHSLTDEKVENILEDIIREFEDGVIANSVSNEKKLHQIFKKLERTIVFCIKLLADNIKKSEFVPIEYEHKFNYSLELENKNTLFLRGIIDRLDILKDNNTTYISIIDYKSGSKDFSISNIYNRLDLQLLLYLEATLNAGIDNPKPAAMLYYSLKKPVISYKVPPEASSVMLALRKQLKMKGLLTSNSAIIEKLDTTLSDINIKQSEFLPVAYKNDGDFNAYSSIATDEEFSLLRNYINTSVEELANGIVNGDVKVMPYRQGNKSACDYCDFSSVCLFDPSSKSDSYRFLKPDKPSEIFEKLKEGCSNVGKMDK